VHFLLTLCPHALSCGETTAANTSLFSLSTSAQPLIEFLCLSPPPLFKMPGGPILLAGFPFLSPLACMIFAFSWPLSGVMPFFCTTYSVRVPPAFPFGEAPISAAPSKLCDRKNKWQILLWTYQSLTPISWLVN